MSTDPNNLMTSRAIGAIVTQCVAESGIWWGRQFPVRIAAQNLGPKLGGRTSCCQCHLKRGHADGSACRCDRFSVERVDGHSCGAGDCSQVELDTGIGRDLTAAVLSGRRNCWNRFDKDATRRDFVLRLNEKVL